MLSLILVYCIIVCLIGLASIFSIRLGEVERRLKNLEDIKIQWIPEVKHKMRDRIEKLEKEFRKMNIINYGG